MKQPGDFLRTKQYFHDLRTSLVALGLFFGIATVVVLLAKAVTLREKAETFEDWRLCRLMAMRAVETGAPASSLSLIRDACIYTNRNR